MSFSYEVPDDGIFFQKLIKYLKIKEEDDLIDLLRNAKCEIRPTSTFGSRSYSYKAYIRFYIPDEKLAQASELLRNKLEFYCQRIMPRDAGYDVYGVSFEPNFLIEDTQESLVEDLNKISHELSEEIVTEIFPDDIKDKGREMTEVYLFLYCVENSLRLFIDKVGKDTFGDNYFTKFNIKREILDSVKIRKREERKNKWIRLRGDSEIFYLDFSDLGNIIQNNWEHFKPFFPRLDWIVPKIEEMAKIRHLVAHNSYVESSEKDLIKTYYRVILKQINDAWK
ncbi:MAG: hypothetical protein HWN66_06090 [Candidatus Helarchaeota archaeon]|nr:hypothetical protein [Candidatus Helarchaeota archaeon]